MAEALWYVVHTYSGYENKVKKDIEMTVENRKLHDLIQEVAVPVEDVIEMKNGQRKTVQRKLMPGYVFVKMVHNTETWYVVRNTRGVTGFVGPDSEPIPLTAAEMVGLGIKLDKDETKENIEIDLKVGDIVTVIAGPWKDCVGSVEAVNPSKQTITIHVDIFGRPTPVELDFAVVKKK